jgi:hypothetical protein
MIGWEVIHYAVAFSVPKKPIQWEVYRPIKGSPGAFIGIVEAPDETSALKAAIEEFGIINHSTND